MNLPSPMFLWNAFIRAVKTFIQSVAAMLTTAQIGILSVHWTSVASVGAVASVVSLMTSFAALDQIGAKAPSPEAPVGEVPAPIPLPTEPIPPPIPLPEVEPLPDVEPVPDIPLSPEGD